MSSRNDEEKYLDRTVAAFDGFKNAFTYSDVLRFLRDRLSLEMGEKEAVERIDDSDMREINDTLPFLLRIAEKPRMFIKSIEEKVPIDQAKRINYNAIAKLSRDSNDWHSRTLISVKPKLIHAEVTEDTLDIYENRFFVTLIDLVYKVVYREYNDCLTKIKNAGTTLALETISKLYTGFKQDWSFNDVCYGNNIKTDSGYRYQLEQHKEQLESTLRRLAIIKSSELYTDLRTKKRITGTVQRTNILMFDHNYHRAYKLWLYLRENHCEEFLIVEDELIEQSVLEKEYRLYCFLALCVCLEKIGAKCTQSAKYTFGPDGLAADGVTKFDYCGNSIEMELDVDGFKLRYHIPNKISQKELAFQKVRHIISDNERETIDEFWFRPCYDNLEQLNQADLNDYLTRLFDSLAPGPDDCFSGRYAMISVNLDTWGEKGLSEDLCRRLFNSGDNLPEDEPPENKERWSDFKTGIALVSAYPFRGPSGLNKICKILYNHLLKPKLHAGKMETCPVCDGRLTPNGVDYICHQCNIKISHTYCKSCDPNKTKPFFWIKYKDDAILEEEGVMSSCESNPLYKMDTISQIMPKCTLTSFDVGAERKSSGNTIYKFKTICPRCGIRLGEDSERNKPI